VATHATLTHKNVLSVKDQLLMATRKVITFVLTAKMGIYLLTMLFARLIGCKHLLLILVPVLNQNAMRTNQTQT
jgi:hypothetical protein